MSVYIPEGTPVLGNTATRFVSTIADPEEPLLTEIMAAFPASLETSFFIQAPSWVPGQDTGKGSPPRRLGLRETFERLTTTTKKLDDIRYVYGPQSPLTDPVNKALATLVEGSRWWAVERLGLDAETEAWAVGDWVNLIPVVCGPQHLSGDPDENQEYTVTQPLSVRGKRIDHVQIA